MGSHRSVAASVRRAGRGDAEALAALVNRAYGIERFFVDGPRTDADEVAALCDDGQVLVLDGPGGELVAAVHVRADGDCGTLGMLSVAPERQGEGLGKRLVAVAEALCAAMGCTRMSLHVVNLRSEVELWYRHLGYRAVGVAPYVNRAVKQPCHFVVMHKPLVAALAA
jgi:GNAT superfamily N-acetyltransferase